MAETRAIRPLLPNLRFRNTNGGIQIQLPETESVGTESIEVDLRVSAYPLGENHPLAHLYGSYDDDPMWADFEAAIRENPNVIE